MPEIDMTVAADDGTLLAGTLTLPSGPGPHPAVLLLHGSGPLERDGNTPKLVMDLGRPMADALAAAGIATPRYDRRGAGATPATGGPPASPATLRTPPRPCAPWPPPDLRADAVGVVGHGEGSEPRPRDAGPDHRRADGGAAHGRRPPVDGRAGL
ncbi:hypothetical protein GCM10010279_15810 [Streptomyces mutabilis]|nr:hypothetical protein GCM10010279_15810 [Streptomyces mutabilis]